MLPLAQPADSAVRMSTPSEEGESTPETHEIEAIGGGRPCQEQSHACWVSLLKRCRHRSYMSRPAVQEIVNACEAARVSTLHVMGPESARLTRSLWGENSSFVDVAAAAAAAAAAG